MSIQQAMNRLHTLPDPDLVGESAYHAVYEVVQDAIMCCADDEGSPEEMLNFVTGALDEVIKWAGRIRSDLAGK